MTSIGWLLSWLSPSREQVAHVVAVIVLMLALAMLCFCPEVWENS